ncbi:MAG: extracellular solute-binding protein [Chloroflexi bacterium]|nr:extracellular solute-binding protein [Chloroflexota bacterium]
MKGLYLLIGVAVVIAFVMGACGAKETPPAKPTEAAGPPVKTVKEASEVEWEKVVQAARREGTVSIITQWSPEARTGIINAFREKYGIDVEFTVVAKGTEATAKLTAERRAGLYLIDIIGLGATTTLNEMKPAGILGAIEPMLMLSEVKDLKNWMGGRLFMDREKLVVPFSAEYSSYVDRNTDLVKEGDITSYLDLLDPRWKGKIVMGDPTVAGSGNAWVSFMARVWGRDKARDYLRDFVKQEPAPIRDLRLSAEWLARGKYAVGSALHAPSLLEFKDAGAPVAKVRVKEGGLVTASGSCVSIPAGQLPHPNAAKVFINWLLTREGQTVFARGIFRPSARTDVPLPADYQGLVPRQGDPVVVEDEEGVMLKGEMIGISKGIFGPLMK